MLMLKARAIRTVGRIPLLAHAAGWFGRMRVASSVRASGRYALTSRSSVVAPSTASSGSGRGADGPLSSFVPVDVLEATSNPSFRSRARHDCTTHGPPCKLISAV